MDVEGLLEFALGVDAMRTMRMGWMGCVRTAVGLVGMFAALGTLSGTAWEQPVCKQPVCKPQG